MKQHRKCLAGMSALLVALSLTGCVRFVGPGIDEAQAPETATGLVDPGAEATESAEPTEEADAEGEQSLSDKIKGAVSGDKEEESDPADGDEASEGQASVADLKKIQLTPAESEVMYMRTVSRIGTLNLEQWILDEEAGEAVYKQHSCLGNLQEVGTGVLYWEHGEEGKSDTIEIVWDGDSPLTSLGLSSMDPSPEFTLNERKLDVMVTARATANLDLELESFKNSCVGAGKMIADFVL